VNGNQRPSARGRAAEDAIGRLLALASLAAALLAASMAAADTTAQAGVQAVVVKRGWHVDVGLAVGALGAALDPVAQAFPRARYLFFGFGDRRYLLSKHPNGPVLLAALWPGRALLLVTAIEAEPESAFGAPEVVRLTLSAEQAERLRRFLAGSFAAAALQAAPHAYAPGPYDESAYFLARADYSALHTCNTWVAEALQASGLPIRSRGVLLALQLWRRVRRLPQANAQGPALEPAAGQVQGGGAPF